MVTKYARSLVVAAIFGSDSESAKLSLLSLLRCDLGLTSQGRKRRTEQPCCGEKTTLQPACHRLTEADCSAAVFCACAEGCGLAPPPSRRKRGETPPAAHVQMTGIANESREGFGVNNRYQARQTELARPCGAAAVAACGMARRGNSTVGRGEAG